MKRIVLVLAMGLIAFIGFGQSSGTLTTNRLVTLIDSLDLSTITGSDTTIYLDVNGNGAWSCDLQFATITGSGTADIVAGNNASSLELYATTATKTLTGASGTLKYDHDRLAWKFIGIKITMGTITAGTLNVTMIRR